MYKYRFEKQEDGSTIGAPSCAKCLENPLWASHLESTVSEDVVINYQLHQNTTSNMVTGATRAHEERIKTATTDGESLYNRNKPVYKNNQASKGMVNWTKKYINASKS